MVATPDNFDNTIQNNIIENNSAAGLFYEHTFMCHHSSNLITGNRIINNDLGLSTIMSEDNTIAYNDIVGSVGYGAAHGMCFGGGQNNRWHHNNFILNHSDTLQASDVGGGIDYWYCVADSEGNHWSDYTGPDNNGDGIGDIPYIIDGDESQDLAPLMNPLVSSIAGNVSDGSDPITDVHVQAIGTNIDDYTDSGGMYALAGLGAGMYDISFTHPLYQDTVVSSVPATLDFSTALDVVMDPHTETDDNDASAPTRFALLQNYPNPFNAETVIKFSLPQSRNISLTIYDLLGKKILTLTDGYLQAGVHSVNFDASDLPSGVYFYRLQSEDRVETKRMILLK